MVNLSWEVTATYPEDDGVTPGSSVSIFPQYLLDKYANVAETAADLEANPIDVVTGPYRLATVRSSHPSTA